MVIYEHISNSAPWKVCPRVKYTTRYTKTRENILSQKENLQKVGEMTSNNNYEINKVG